MATHRTVTLRYADLLLGGDGSLERFVMSRRGQGMSWRLVERALYEATEGEIDVTFETLRPWFPDEHEAAS